MSGLNKIMNENIYIKLHEFGEKNLDGFNFEKIIDGLGALKNWEQEMIKENIINAHYNKGYLGASGFHEKPSIFYCLNYAGDYNGRDNKYILSPASYFDYIDYLELKESLKTARKAHITSIVAIGIAVVTLVSSIIFSIIEIYS